MVLEVGQSLGQVETSPKVLHMEEAYQTHREVGPLGSLGQGESPEGQNDSDKDRRGHQGRRMEGSRLGEIDHAVGSFGIVVVVVDDADLVKRHPVEAETAGPAARRTHQHVITSSF